MEKTLNILAATIICHIYPQHHDYIPRKTNMTIEKQRRIHLYVLPDVQSYLLGRGAISEPHANHSQQTPKITFSEM